MKSLEERNIERLKNKEIRLHRRKIQKVNKKIKLRKKTHKERLKEILRDIYEINYPSQLQQNKKTQKEIKEERKKRQEYYYKNREKILKKQKDLRLKEENNIKFIKNKKRLVKSLRSRVYLALRDNIKSKITMQLIGCSIDELRKHIELQFKDGMDWKNHGAGFNGRGMKEWHIDHIIPCASFDLSKPEEQQKCFHYSNLQPLWATENLQKNSVFENIRYTFNNLI